MKRIIVLAALFMTACSTSKSLYSKDLAIVEQVKSREVWARRGLSTYKTITECPDQMKIGDTVNISNRSYWTQTH